MRIKNLFKKKIKRIVLGHELIAVKKGQYYYIYYPECPNCGRRKYVCFHTPRANPFVRAVNPNQFRPTINGKTIEERWHEYKGDTFYCRCGQQVLVKIYRIYDETRRIWDEN